MTLTQTLRLEERFLKYDDLRALDHCERRWQEENRPLKRWEMVNFIEKMLRELQGKGIGYPKVLLLRKKEIQRREFTICEPSAPSGEPQICPACHGTGWINYRTAPQPCTCDAGKPHSEQLTKWGMKF